MDFYGICIGSFMENEFSMYPYLYGDYGAQF
jgi:hypothetical protein